MDEIRQYFEERFSVYRKGVKNEAFTIKILVFKIFIFIVFQNHYICQIFKKSCFIIFIDVWSLCYQKYTITSFIFDNVIRITL